MYLGASIATCPIFAQLIHADKIAGMGHRGKRLIFIVAPIEARY
jgi:hypothetical protein